MHILIKVVKKSRPDGYFSRLQKMLEALQLQGESYILGQIFASTTTTSIDIEKFLHIFRIVHNVSFLEMSMNHL